MNVLITGGAGFLGRRLAQRLLQRGTLVGRDGREQAIAQLTLVDVVASAAFTDPRVREVAGDIADPRLIDTLVDSQTDAIFHLAAVVSGMAEADFDIGMRVNLDATRALLEICRARKHVPRFVFTSSVAVFGGALPDPVPESAALTPQTSYGTQKAIAELLINDYTRKGFVDGRSLRLPTISVRPGKANAAASSFASGIIREPLNGQAAICPVGPDTRLWLLSPRTVIECLVTAHQIAGDAIGPNRAISLPGITVTVGEMAAALERAAGAEVAGRILWQRDTRLERMVLGWPGALETSRARALGFPADESFETMIREYIEEHLPSSATAGQ